MLNSHSSNSKIYSYYNQQSTDRTRSKLVRNFLVFRRMDQVGQFGLVSGPWMPDYNVGDKILPQQSRCNPTNNNWILRSFKLNQLPDDLEDPDRQGPTISVIFIVTSSSLVPDLRSRATLGRMQRGGTATRVIIMSRYEKVSEWVS